jgi:hypothetical protein
MKLVSTEQAAIVLGIHSKTAARKYIALLKKYYPDFPKPKKIDDHIKLYCVKELKEFSNRYVSGYEAAKICFRRYYAEMKSSRERVDYTSFEYSENIVTPAIQIAKNVKGIKSLNKNFLAGNYGPRPLRRTNAIKKLTAKHFKSETKCIRVTGWN